MALFTYFQQLAATHYDVLDHIGMAWSAQETLAAALEAYRTDAIATLQQLQRPIPAIKVTPAGVGLNTVGLLSDRLTILVIKEWCLRHQHQDDAGARHLYDNQTLDIIAALIQAPPAKGDINTKLTTHDPQVQVHTWEAAIYDLFATNTIIWQAQESLYRTDSPNVSSAPESWQLQRYRIPHLNVQRDRLIQCCEQLYWQER